MNDQLEKKRATTSPVFFMVECDKCHTFHYWGGQKTITCKKCSQVIEVFIDNKEQENLADYLREYNGTL